MIAGVSASRVEGGPGTLQASPPFVASTGVLIDSSSLVEVMQDLGIDEDACDSVGLTVVGSFGDCVDVAGVPQLLRDAGVPAVCALAAFGRLSSGKVLYAVADPMLVWLERAPGPSACACGLCGCGSQMSFPAGAFSPAEVMSTVQRVAGLSLGEALANRLLAPEYLVRGLAWADVGKLIADKDLTGGEALKFSVVQAVRGELMVWRRRRVGVPAGLARVSASQYRRLPVHARYPRISLVVFRGS